jgi:POT family proton-dependent oligopeptide transporter
MAKEVIIDDQQHVEYFSDATKGHPKQLILLFITEMWERFSFYGMRALLILYMVNVLKYSDDKGNLVYGSYQALVYTLPLLGGFLADRIFGFRRSVVLGGLLMSIGHLILAMPQEEMFYVGLAFLISGNGFFKPNISSMVGRLYRPGDARRDGGFSIFYLGINVGAFLGSLACGYIGQNINWHYGFGLAGIFMVLGLIIFLIYQKSLGNVGLPPKEEEVSNLKQKQIGVVVLSILQVPLFIYLLINYEIMGYLLVPFSVAATILLVFVAFQQEKQARDKMITAIVLIVFSAFFWAFYEQGGGSLNLYASRNVDMLGMSSAAINNAINPFYIFTLTFPVAWLMLRLAKKQQEPTTPAKFAISFLLLGIGFYVFVTGGKFANEGMVNLFYFAAGYLMITLGELFLSPIGLSMVTKLSPEKFTGMMMGYWFLASAMGQYLAGVIGTLMSIPHGEGGAVDAISALGVYSSVFQKICLVSLVFGVVLFLLVPMLRKWMHDVK